MALLRFGAASSGEQQMKTRGAQSCSVWSRARYLIPRLSSVSSTSSGMRPRTRAAYIPRTYFAVQPSVRREV
jgi:hypothetical protein